MTAPLDTHWVCLAGGDGSGKSTQAAALVAALVAEGVDAVEVGIWDGLTDPVTAPLLGFSDRAQVQEYLRVLGPRARALFLFHALHAAIDLAASRHPQVAILNAHWYKYFASEVALGGDPAELRAWVTGFPEPARTFYLRVEPAVAMARKSELSPYESGFGADEEFVQVQADAQVALDGLSAELGWIELDGAADRAVLTAQIAGEILAQVRA